MVVLDIAIVNVALPSIKLDLGFSQENLQWVISAYALFFGGFLLLGGRLADILGRRRIFIAGLILFTVASLLAGLAWSEGSLIAARALQGLGAAMISPAALSILTTTFAEGKERNIALGVWGAVGGFGAAAGVLLGGVITDTLSWEWIFYVNIPIGLAGLIFTPMLLEESRDARVKSFDALGAVLVTSGLMTLVFAITKANDYGWGSATTWSLFAAAGALLAGFVAWERRHPEPLMRFGILRTSTILGANVAGFILGTALFGMFLMLTLYMQQVLGYSAMKTGIGYLAVAGTAILWSGVAAQLVTKVGVKPVLIAGMAFLTAGLLYFTQVSVDGTYLGDLLPGFLLIGVALGFSFVPISIAALAGVQPAEAGLASGLINTSQQIGGALGIAALSAVAINLTTSAAEDGAAQPVALVDGFQGAFWAAAVVAALGIVVSMTLIRREELSAETVARALARSGLELAQQLEELRGAADHDVGGLAQLRRAFGGRHRHRHAELEARERLERVEVGRVVARIQSPFQPSLAKQMGDGRALVRGERRPQLEHFPAEPGDKALRASTGRDRLEHAQRLRFVLCPAVVEGDRQRFSLDILPVDGRSEPQQPLAPRRRLRDELEPVLADVHELVEPDDASSIRPGAPADAGDERVTGVQPAQLGPRLLRHGRLVRHVHDRGQHAVDVEEERGPLGLPGQLRDQVGSGHRPRIRRCRGSS